MGGEDLGFIYKGGLGKKSQEIIDTGEEGIYMLFYSLCVCVCVF